MSTNTNPNTINIAEIAKSVPIPSVSIPLNTGILRAGLTLTQALVYGYILHRKFIYMDSSPYQLNMDASNLRRTIKQLIKLGVPIKRVERGHYQYYGTKRTEDFLK